MTIQHLRTNVHRLLLLAALAAVGLLIAGCGGADEPRTAEQTMNGDMEHASADELYVCSMHPYEAAHQQASCTICGMQLSHVEGYEAGDPMPEASDLYVDPNNPMTISMTRHEGWIPMTESSIYVPKSEDMETGGEMDHGGGDDHAGHKH